jgi:hypothetical protein
MSRRLDDGPVDEHAQPVGCLRFIFWALLGIFGLTITGIGISECIRFCGCKTPTNVDEARADLERAIERTPRRFAMTGRPQQLVITPLPAGDEISSQGGWFFKVVFGPDGSRQTLYVTNFGCARIDVSIGP